MASDGRGASNSHPPDEGDLNMGEIPISLASREFSGPLGKDRKPIQCLPKVAAIPSMVVKSTTLRHKIQYMPDHALIGKFIGLQPSKKASIW